MASENPPKDYEEALQKFLVEEEERRAMFEKSLQEKKKHLGGGDLKMSKAKVEAEIARKKLAIDEELRVKVNQMWKDYEDKVSDMKDKNEADIQEMVKQKTALLMKKIDSLKDLYAKKMNMRKQTLEKDIKMAQELMNKAMANPLSDSLEDRRAFLKKELVDFKKFAPTKTIADEDALRRLGVTITKQSIASSKEYIIYRGTSDKKDCLVKIVVLSDRSSNYRSSIRECSKVARFLMSGNNGEPRHPCFVKLYNFFLSDNKTYLFLEEHSTVNLETRTHDRKISQEQVKQALKQVLDGLEFMHTRAIAHLNVRGESVIFDKENNAKLIGLCYSKIYFNPDTETFFKLPKVDHKREFLPGEVFSDEFDPIPADVFSLGYLLYAAISDLKKKHRTRRIGHLDYANLNDAPTAKAFVELLTSRDPVKRLKLSQIKSQSYFTEQEE